MQFLQASGVVSVLQAEACNTDTTPTQPHWNPNTHRTKNNTTNVVIQQNSHKLLMMDILMSEACWAHKKWNKIASDIKLVFYSSKILKSMFKYEILINLYVLSCMLICWHHPSGGGGVSAGRTVLNQIVYSRVNLHICVYALVGHVSHIESSVHCHQSYKISYWLTKQLTRSQRYIKQSTKLN